MGSGDSVVRPELSVQCGCFSFPAVSRCSVVCFFVFRVVTVYDHPPNAYAFGSRKTALENICVITIVMHGLCDGNHDGCYSLHCAPESSEITLTRVMSPNDHSCPICSQSMGNEIWVCCRCYAYGHPGCIQITVVEGYTFCLLRLYQEYTRHPFSSTAAAFATSACGFLYWL